MFECSIIIWIELHNDKQLIFLSGIPILGNQMLPFESDWRVGRALSSGKVFVPELAVGQPLQVGMFQNSFNWT